MFEAEAAGVRQMMCVPTLTAAPFYAVLGFVTQGETIVTLASGLELSAVQMRCEL